MNAPLNLNAISPKGALFLGNKLFEQGQITSAVSYYEQASATHKIIECVHALIEKKDGLAASELFVRLNIIPPPKMLLDCADACLESGDLKNGISLYAQAGVNPPKEKLVACGDHWVDMVVANCEILKNTPYSSVGSFRGNLQIAEQAYLLAENKDKLVGVVDLLISCLNRMNFCDTAFKELLLPILEDALNAAGEECRTRCFTAIGDSYFLLGEWSKGVDYYQAIGVNEKDIPREKLLAYCTYGIKYYHAHKDGSKGWGASALERLINSHNKVGAFVELGDYAINNFHQNSYELACILSILAEKESPEIKERFKEHFVACANACLVNAVKTYPPRDPRGGECNIEYYARTAKLLYETAGVNLPVSKFESVAEYALNQYCSCNVAIDYAKDLYGLVGLEIPKELLIARGNRCLQQGNLDGASMLYMEAGESVPDDEVTKCLQVRLDYLIQEGDLASAEKVVEALVS